VFDESISENDYTSEGASVDVDIPTMQVNDHDDDDTIAAKRRRRENYKSGDDLQSTAGTNNKFGIPDSLLRFLEINKK
jgi:hypothetical protein